MTYIKISKGALYSIHEFSDDCMHSRFVYLSGGREIWPNGRIWRPSNFRYTARGEAMWTKAFTYDVLTPEEVFLECI